MRFSKPDRRSDVFDVAARCEKNDKTRTYRRTQKKVGTMYLVKTAFAPWA